MKKVLFVCTGNTCRSPMAAYLFNDMICKEGMGSIVYASSAGLAAFDGMKATDEAFAVMLAEGIDIRDHRARMLTRENVHDADLVIGVTARHAAAIRQAYQSEADKIFSLGEYIGAEADVQDPYGGSVDTYLATYIQLKEAFVPFIARMRGAIE